MLASNYLRGERTAPVASTARKRDQSPAADLRTNHRSGRRPSRVALLVGWPTTLPNLLRASPDHRALLDTSPRLIAANPARALLERWRTELNVLRRRSPASDAVKVLADCIDELSAAITAGHDATIQLTVSESHALSHIPVSTLRWLCNHKPDLIGARKREGVWYVDRALFERYLVSSNGRTAAVGNGGQLSPAVAEETTTPIREPRADVGAELL